MRPPFPYQPFHLIYSFLMGVEESVSPVGSGSPPPPQALAPTVSHRPEPQEPLAGAQLIASYQGCDLCLLGAP